MADGDNSMYFVENVSGDFKQGLQWQNTLKFGLLVSMTRIMGGRRIVVSLELGIDCGGVIACIAMVSKLL